MSITLLQPFNLANNGSYIFGNVTANYFSGDGSQLTGIPSTKTTFSDTPPVSPGQGDTWIVGNVATQLIYFNDNTSNQWADMTTLSSVTVGNIVNAPAGNIYEVQLANGLGGFSASSNFTFTNSLLSVVGNASVTGNVFSGDHLPLSNVTYDLGSSSQRWKDLWLSNSTIYLGDGQISANATALIITNPAGGVTTIQGATPTINTGAISATSTVTGGNLVSSGFASITGSITAGNLSVGGNIIGNSIFANSLSVSGFFNPTTISASGNITGGNLLTPGVISATGNATVGNLITTGATGNITGANVIVATTLSANNIINGGGNGIGNIGNSTVYFNTAFVKATSAQYADLAEIYISDLAYKPGTVLMFGGEREVTVATEDTTAVAGVVSTEPAYLMNATANVDCGIALALQGRVPTSVVGKVHKGDLMVSAGGGAAKATQSPQIGQVIGKSLENFDGPNGVIEIAVGRL